MEKRLGRIESASYGFGGYQEAQFGLTVSLGGEGWGVGDFWGPWATRTDGAKWTMEDRARQLVEVNDRLLKILKDAKVDCVHQLIGKPVEVEFSGNTLQNWRILKEVL